MMQQIMAVREPVGESTKKHVKILKYIMMGELIVCFIRIFLMGDFMNGLSELVSALILYCAWA